MIAINFSCNECGGEKGHIELCLDEALIICDDKECGEVEQIKDFDIIGNSWN